MPLIILGVLLLLALIFLPQLWVRAVLKAHQVDRPDFPGTGGELARHLLDEAGLHDVAVEVVKGVGDHYDPRARAVRLTPEHHGGRSIAAVAVATHEVAHALQHADGSALLALRTDLAGTAVWIDRIATGVLLSIPILGLVVRSPALAAIQVLTIVVLMAAELALHVVTLPVELDASFRRALPILDRGRYLQGEDLVAARRVLRAAAFTYVAAGLVGLLNVARILRF